MARGETEMAHASNLYQIERNKYGTNDNLSQTNTTEIY